jgi:bifunctional non-homologous end joining protein LigD
VKPSLRAARAHLDAAVAAMEGSGAHPGPMPEVVAPQLATLVHRPPEGDEWLHEIKFDGYRLMARIDGGIRLLTRRGEDWTDRFTVIAHALDPLLDVPAFLDGEIVGLDDGGRSSFSRLQQQLTAGPQADLHYFAFDLLFLAGRDLLEVPLADRKRLLERALVGAGPRVHLSTHLRGNGPAVFREACSLGMEGIVSKRATSRYASGRSKAWLKTKCGREADFVVCGYVEREGSPAPVTSLVLGAHDEKGALIYLGRVGTGFSDRDREVLKEYLDQIERDAPALESPPAPMRGEKIHWVEPVVVALVAYTEITHEGNLRHPSFKGLRTDREATEVRLSDVAGSGTGYSPA